MKAFEWADAPTVEDAVKLLTPADASADPDEMPRALAGGQDLLTTMKAYIAQPPRVVNLKTIKGLDRIQTNKDGSVRIGALVTLNALEEHPQIIERFPGLAQAAHSIATPQIRNLGTVGGNLCQRPRCWYFRLENYKCLKKGGTECFAAGGENKYNAIFGGGPSYFVHPSDLAPMLVALNATVTIAGPQGSREIPLESFFTLPTVDDPARKCAQGWRDRHRGRHSEFDLRDAVHVPEIQGTRIARFRDGLRGDHHRVWRGQNGARGAAGSRRRRADSMACQRRGAIPCRQETRRCDGRTSGTARIEWSSSAGA